MAEEKDNNRVPEAELILPRGKKVILQAEDTDYKRGLIVELLDNGGYEMAYWYDKPDKPYPVEILVDGVSIKPDGKVVEMKFHPQDYYDEQDELNEGDTYEKMAAKGKKAGNLKQGTVRKRLGIAKDKKVPLAMIRKELSRLKKMDKDDKKKGVQLGDKNQKYYKALQLAKTLKTTTNENVAPNHDGKAAPYGSGYERVQKQVKESLRDWFKKEDWVRINTSGNISGKCGTMKKGKATTRCLPRKKAQSLTKAQRKATVAKKVRGSKKGKQFVGNTKSAKYRKKSNEE
tara:strand:- start:5 stop:868 length:864 start_codon:yes stop_codon:yes gene_type:complete